MRERRRTNRLRGSTFFNRGIYEDTSLAFIETSGGREKGKAGRACETVACAYACPGILDTQSSSNKQEREKKKERARGEEAVAAEGSRSYRSAKGSVCA